PRLCARGRRILRLACGARREAACGHRERACRRLCRAAAESPLRADCEIAPRRLAPFVRLDGDGQIMPVNPAAAVRGPRHIVRRGKTPVLDPAEARQLIDSIDTTTVIGLCGRAFMGVWLFS